MSKELFFKMREEMTYNHDFTKREAKQQGVELAKQFDDKETALSQLARFTEVINSAFKTLKDDLDFDGKELNVNGVKFQKVEGGKIYDFAQDAVWSHLESKIKKLKSDQKYREDLLKKSYIESQKVDNQNPILDDDEIVEPVKLKGYRKSYIKILF